MEFKIVTLTSNNRVVYHLNNILGFNDVLLQGQPVIDPVSGTTSSCWDSLKFSKLFCKSQNQLPYNIIRYDKNLLLKPTSVLGLFKFEIKSKSLGETPTGFSIKIGILSFSTCE